jgi:hypothetical protein
MKKVLATKKISQSKRQISPKSQKSWTKAFIAKHRIALESLSQK